MAAPEKVYVLVEIDTRSSNSISKAEKWSWYGIDRHVKEDGGVRWHINTAVQSIKIASAFVEEEGVLRKIYTGD